MLRTWMKRRATCLVLLAAFSVLAWTAPVNAQRRRPQSQFHVGQKVQIEHFGRICEGEVIGITSFGQVKVSFTDNGRQQSWDFQPDQVWLPKTAPAAAGRPKVQMHTWTDSSGLYKIEARFIELTDGKVTLEKDDGTRKTMPLDKLSQSDQELAKKLAAETPPENPFEGNDNSAAPGAVSGSTGADGGSGAKPLNDEDIIAPAGTWSSVREIVIDASAKGEFVPDAAAPASIEHMRPIMLDLTKAATDRNFQQEKLAGFFYLRQRQRLVVVSTNRDLRGGRRGPRLESCDLKLARSQGAVVLDTGITPCDMSPDGTSVACMLEGNKSAFHKERGIEVWRLDQGVKLAKRWNPNDTRGKTDGFHVDRAQFISHDLLLTVSSGEGTATVWNIDDARAVYTVPVDRLSRAALSVNRKQMAVSCEGVIAVLDAATGGTLLILKDANAPLRSEPSINAALENAPSRVAAERRRFHGRAGMRFAFRPDGRQLTALDNDHLQVWDLETQKLLQEMWLPSTSGQSAADLLEWVDNDHLLVNGADLINIPNRIVLWHYDVPGQEKSTECVVNGCLGFGYGEIEGTRGRGRAALRAGVFFLSLPHPAAFQVLAGLSEEKLLAMKAGSQVALDLRMPVANPQESEALAASYTAQLKAWGISVVPGAPLSFQATVENGKTETLTYRSIGMGGEETVNVSAQTSRLALVENGKVIWEKSARTGGASMIVRHKEGETIQSVLDRGNQESAMAFFRNLSLPGCVTRQGEHGAYGFSRVTPMGTIPYDPGIEPQNQPGLVPRRR